MEQGLTVILANGTFPHADAPLDILHRAEHIVCCDGAAISLMAHGMTPHAVIGDLDSITGELRRQLDHLVVHVTEQDTNDLNKAFRYCLAQGWTERIVLLGATGKREDHSLGNISLLADFATQVPSIQMVTDDGIFTVMQRSGSHPSRAGQQVSIFALDSQTPIYSTGLKYPLKGLAPTRWWHATLNEALGNEFTLEFPQGHALLIYRAF